jgi:long-chain acyl-CoA synthetase
MSVTSEDLVAAAERGMTLAAHAAAAPDRPAIVCEAGNRTFGQLNVRANQLARALRRRGVAAGQSLALLCSNRPEFAEVVAAGQRSGLRFTPVNWHLTGGEAGYIVDDCEATTLIADARFPELAIEAAAAAPRARVRLAIGGAIDGFESYEDAVDAEDGSDIEDPVLGGSMLYTSGTTGRPKGVHRPTPPAASVVTSAALYGYVGGEDLHLCTGPLYHAAPLAFSLSAPLAAGVGVVLMDGWDAEAALPLIEQHRVTHTHMVPTMFHRLLSLPDDVRAGHDLSSLRFVIHGAAPCPVAVKQGLMDWLGPVVWEYYAATEGVGTFCDPHTWLSRPGTVGKPNPAEQVKIGDENGSPLPPNEVGLVWIKAPAIGRFEYFKDEGKTSGSYSGEYFTLGDMGYLDAEGFLFLTDRTANLIISGGVNIYPAEVDAVLLEHPAVADVATIGVPNSEWGEEVKAVVELQAGLVPSTALADELVAFCRERLARFKCPRTVDFVDELPRQDNGKIYKRVLRDRYREATQ